MPYKGFGKSDLRKMSLRRALWQSRVAGRNADLAGLAEPERSATDFLRDHVRSSLQDAAIDGIDGCTVIPVESEWQSDVLKHDPRIFCAENPQLLADFLEEPEAREVMALRRAALTVDHVKALCPQGLCGKTVFIEV